MISLNCNKGFKIGPNNKPFIIVALACSLKREFGNKKSDHVKCKVLGPLSPPPNLAPSTLQLYELFLEFAFPWNNIFENAHLHCCPPSFYNLLRPTDLDNATLLLIISSMPYFITKYLQMWNSLAQNQTLKKDLHLSQPTTCNAQQETTL